MSSVLAHVRGILSNEREKQYKEKYKIKKESMQAIEEGRKTGKIRESEFVRGIFEKTTSGGQK